MCLHGAAWATSTAWEQQEQTSIPDRGIFNTLQVLKSKLNSHMAAVTKNKRVLSANLENFLARKPDLVSFKMEESNWVH